MWIFVYEISFEGQDSVTVENQKTLVLLFRLIIAKYFHCLKLKWLIKVSRLSRSSYTI